MFIFIEDPAMSRMYNTRMLLNTRHAYIALGHTKRFVSESFGKKLSAVRFFFLILKIGYEVCDYCFLFFLNKIDCFQ